MFLDHCARSEASDLNSQSVDDVIVGLKKYAAEASKSMSCVGTASSTEEEMHLCHHNIDLKLQVATSGNDEMESHELELDESCVENQELLALQTINSSYNTFIGPVISGRVDCTRRPSQNAPSHSHIITLVEHIMDLNDALLFHTNMNMLKETCAVWMGGINKKTCIPSYAS